MIKNKIQELINFGNYDKAMETLDAKELNAENLVFKSRLYELTGHFEKAIELAKLALKKTENLLHPIHEINAISALSYGYWRMLDFTTAKLNIEKGYEIMKHIAPNPRATSSIATLYNIDGLIYWTIGEFEDAMLKFEQGLSLRKGDKDPIAISYSLNNIGNTFLLMKEFSEAHDYYKKSMMLRQKHNVGPGIAGSYNSLARYYDNIKKNSEALICHKRSLDLWETLGNKQFIAKSHRFIGTHYSNTNKMDQAMIHLCKANDYFSEIPNITDTKITKSLIKKLKAIINSN